MKLVKPYGGLAQYSVTEPESKGIATLFALGEQESQEISDGRAKPTAKLFQIIESHFPGFPFSSNSSGFQCGVRPGEKYAPSEKAPEFFLSGKMARDHADPHVEVELRIVGPHKGRTYFMTLALCRPHPVRTVHDDLVHKLGRRANPTISSPQELPVTFSAVKEYGFPDVNCMKLIQQLYADARDLVLRVEKSAGMTREELTLLREDSCLTKTLPYVN